jgi:hypothetical protein
MEVRRVARLAAVGSPLAVFHLTAVLAVLAEGSLEIFALLLCLV